MGIRGSPRAFVAERLLEHGSGRTLRNMDQLSATWSVRPTTANHFSKCADKDTHGTKVLVTKYENKTPLTLSLKLSLIQSLSPKSESEPEP